MITLILLLIATILFEPYLAMSLGITLVTIAGWTTDPSRYLPIVWIAGVIVDVQAYGHLGVASIIYILLASALYAIRRQLGWQSAAAIIATGVANELIWQLVREQRLIGTALVMQTLVIVLVLILRARLQGGEGVYLKK